MTHLPKHQILNPNRQFSQLSWYVEYYSVHAHMAWSQKFRKSEISLVTGTGKNDFSHLCSAFSEVCAQSWQQMQPLDLLLIMRNKTGPIMWKVVII